MCSHVYVINDEYSFSILSLWENVSPVAPNSKSNPLSIALNGGNIPFNEKLKKQNVRSFFRSFAPLELCMSIVQCYGT